MLKFGVLAWRIVGGVCTGFFIGLFAAIFFVWVNDFDANVLVINACSIIGAGVGGVIAWQSWGADYNRPREQDQSRSRDV